MLDANTLQQLVNTNPQLRGLVEQFAQAEQMKQQWTNQLNGLQQNPYLSPTYNTPQSVKPPQPPVNSEIVQQFARSQGYQTVYNQLFFAFLEKVFMNQFVNSPEYADLKKWSEANYPQFEKSYVEAKNKQEAPPVVEEKPKKNGNSKE